MVHTTHKDGKFGDGGSYSFTTHSIPLDSLFFNRFSVLLSPEI